MFRTSVMIAVSFSLLSGVSARAEEPAIDFEAAPACTFKTNGVACSSYSTQADCYTCCRPQINNQLCVGECGCLTKPATFDAGETTGN